MNRLKKHDKNQQNRSGSRRYENKSIEKCTNDRSCKRKLKTQQFVDVLVISTKYQHNDCKWINILWFSSNCWYLLIVTLTHWNTLLQSQFLYWKRVIWHIVFTYSIFDYELNGKPINPKFCWWMKIRFSCLLNHNS